MESQDHALSLNSRVIPHPISVSITILQSQLRKQLSSNQNVVNKLTLSKFCKHVLAHQNVLNMFTLDPR